MDSSKMSRSKGSTLLALACDYDGTLAHEGLVSTSTILALKRYRGAGSRLVLVTGRETSDLCSVCSCVPLFDRVIAENGAVMHWPATGQTRTLAPGIPHEFVRSLRGQGVTPLGTGRVIVATTRRWEQTLLDVIAGQRLDLWLTYNKNSIMVLPAGVDKGTGLRAALGDLGIAAEQTVAIGDAENDESMLARAGFSVAVANALPSVKLRVDMVTEKANGCGVEELIDWLLDMRH
jgi:hydroxymethylpyrimidine pyrophosphatase-like HAD family hydrolase